MNSSNDRLVRIGALAVGAALLVIASVPAFAQPVVYHVNSLTGMLTANPASSPNTVIFPDYPHNYPGEQRVATIIPNGTTQPNSIMFNGGDFNFSQQFLNPTPATAFGVFFSSQGWTNGDSPGTIGPNPARTTSTAVANGWESSLPNFPSTGPQGTAALQRVTPGAAKFGGAWQIGQTFISKIVFSDGVGGFIAGVGNILQIPGHAETFTNLASNVGDFHPTTNPSSPVFSSTACTPTCPWTTGALIHWQQEQTGHRWTTGMATGRHNNPPITFLPPVTTKTFTGADNRTGPISSMGTLQLVSGHSSMGRGAVNTGGAVQHKLTITFLPEPGAVAMLAGGFLGLLALRQRARR